MLIMDEGTLKVGSRVCFDIFIGMETVLAVDYTTNRALLCCCVGRSLREITFEDGVFE